MFRCNFEYGKCIFEDLRDDDFDWTRQRGSTPSGATGPLFDHTYGTTAGNVMRSVCTR
jgi:hypothetical protein